MSNMLEVLSYNPSTGSLYRTDLKREVGTTCTSTGYIKFSYKNKTQLAHRVIWRLVTGTTPNQIDHINGDRSDNSLGNLREVDVAQQATNKVGWTSTGLKGVHWNKARSKYQVRVRKDNKVHHVGYYDCPAEAKIAYDKKATELHGEYYNGKHCSPTLPI